MLHTADAIERCLLDAHGITAALDDRTEESVGVDNQLFVATLDAASMKETGWPTQVVVRVGWNANSIGTAARVERMMAWCVERGYPVVPILAHGELDGTGYLVMPLIDAEPSIGILRGPWRAPILCDRIASLLSRLHSLDPAGWPGPTLTADSALADAVRAGSAVPGVAPMLEWLTEHRRLADDSGEPSVCHLDLHPMNVLWKWGTDPVVIDWDTAALAPPAADIAFSVELTSIGGATVPSRIVRTASLSVGRSLAATTLIRYRRREDVDPDALRWWRALLLMQATMWARSITVMGVAPRPEASAAVPPQFDATVARRFGFVTGRTVPSPSAAIMRA